MSKVHAVLFLWSSVLLAQVVCYDKLLVDQLRVEFLKFEDDMWQYVLQERGDINVDPGLYLIKKFSVFDKMVQQMPDDPLHGMQVVRRAHPFLLVYSDLKIIHDMYDKFRRFHNQSLSPSNKDYNEYQPRITSDDIVGDILHDVKNNANHTIVRIFERSLASGDDNLISEVFNILLEKNYQCQNYSQPLQQVFYNLYNALALADLKGYIMLQFAYLAQRLYEKGNNTQASLLAREQYKQRANITGMTLRGALEITKGTIENNQGKVYRCDPAIHVEGKTYEQLTRLLQGHIQNEVDLSSSKTCTDTCEGYSETTSHGCYDSSSEYCRNVKPCTGKILGCKFVESHFKACISPNWSNRRYEYIQYKSGRTFGVEKSCSYKNVNSWFRWFVHCSYCFCLCDQQGPTSDRYFSLRPVLANTNNNQVITGLRIIKHNRIIHLQIQEGKLLPFGFIDSNTVRWTPVDDFKITDYKIKNGHDYHTMSYYNRSFFLDELYTHESDHILTGVGFEFIEGHLRFKVKVTRFNFKTGLLSNESYDIYGPGRRLKISFKDPDIPTKSPPSEPNWESDRFIEFTYSDIDKDAAQTTIPFIDRQHVTSQPAVPLRGAGIYYKGKPGYGGFIAPTISAYDYSKHLIVDFPNAKYREDILEDFGVIVN